MELFIKMFDIFCAIVGFVYAYRIYKKPAKDNPFKRYRIIMTSALSFCFIMIVSAKGWTVLAMDMIGFIIWIIQWYFDIRDDKYNIQHFDKKYNLEHKN